MKASIIRASIANLTQQAAEKHFTSPPPHHCVASSTKPVLKKIITTLNINILSYLP